MGGLTTIPELVSSLSDFCDTTTELLAERVHENKGLSGPFRLSVHHAGRARLEYRKALPTLHTGKQGGRWNQGPGIFKGLFFLTYLCHAGPTSKIACPGQGDGPGSNTLGA